MSDWSRIECELIVQDYMSMYEKEMRGESYSKAEHRRQLRPKLSQRSEGSIEFKHQNISAVLIDLGYFYIPGYKPAKNYQFLLKEIVQFYLSVNEENVAALSDELLESVASVSGIEDWCSILTEAPDRLPLQGEKGVREFSPKKCNYSEREARNKRLGESGEEFVMHYERCRLTSVGRNDLAKDVEWTSREKGDGAGYDIRSFDEDKDKELFIEVKTTNSGKYQPFFISDNEVAFSEIYATQYALYRVYQFRDAPRLFTLPGDLRENVHLHPKTYRANF
jgi:hypothetical protein